LRGSIPGSWNRLARSLGERRIIESPCLLRDSIAPARGEARRDREGGGGGGGGGGRKEASARLAPSSPGVVIDCIIKSVYFRGRCYRSPSQSISLAVAWRVYCLLISFPSLPCFPRPGEPPPKPFVSERESDRRRTRAALSDSH